MFGKNRLRGFMETTYSCLRSLIILAVLFPAFAAAAESRAGKPLGPLLLVLSAEAPILADSIIPVTLSVTPLTDGPHLKISIELPESLAHYGGSLNWSGSAQKDQAILLEFQVGPVGNQSFEIFGRANVTLPNGVTWAQATSLVLETQGPEKPAPRIKQDRQGSSLIEIPVP